ncbi:glycosyltransferase family 4 protein [Legionella fallonii]|uniref:Putative glycosyl transferase n=1 Tax=Legionella fallonii LLAP-10 TaxID=1212491 RepID=A0A098GAP0_9GAMM|nr:glycosyltransferase family 1 protein [Legionella fallonii]CEG59047.1 putative glycosyl transferase [Legionella fallonii LLAP-10]
MKHIVIDISSLINDFRRKRSLHGVTRVTLAYLHYYLDNMQALVRLKKRVIIFPKEISKEVALLLLSWDLSRLSELIRIVIKGILSSRRALPSTNCFLLKTDHGGFKNPNYIKAINDKQLRLLVVIHDLIPILYPEYCASSNSPRFSQCLSVILEHAKGILAVSNATHSDLSNYVLSTRKNCPPVITATLAPGISPGLPIDKPLIDEPYFITISAIGPRKNHLLLLRIWRNLINKLGSKTPKLVIVGMRNNPCWNTLAMLDRCEALRDFVIETEASDKELANYLCYARALLFPSFLEGYGLPLVEALSVNVPVIASDLAVFREIAGAVPDFLDPLDGKGWMEYIENYAQEDSSLRRAQMQRMTNFCAPKWHEHFAKVDVFMNELEGSL